MSADRSSPVPAAVLLAVVLLAVATAWAEPPALELEVPAAQVRVGDRLEVVAAARGGDGWLWGEPTAAVEPGGPWAVAAGPAAVAGARPPAWKLVLVPLAVGEQALPVVSVTARPPDGEPVTVAASEPPAVTVASVLDAGDEAPEPAPLRDPIGARGFAWEWFVPALAALLPLLAGAVWLWRSRSRGGDRVPDRALLPPLAELEALAGELEGRIGRDPADAVCDRLAAGLRRYLERRTGEPAGEMTSFELRLLARRLGWPEIGQRLVQRVMAVTDRVRFGRRPASETELRAAVADAAEAARSVEGFLEAAETPETAAEVGR